tara:strand:+ start:1158 stop:3134 length:1977 start_codon:yes stop_codon:yes gene_type:complete
MANIFTMKTFFDIVSLGEESAADCHPIVSNWPQVRAHLYLFGHVCGGLDQCPITGFRDRFSESFHDLDPAEQEAFPSLLTYQAARREISRLLATLGYTDDPWEALIMMIRQAGRDDIERNLPGLKTPALAAGLAPSDIRADWVWSLDAEKGIVTEDQLQQRKEREARNCKVPEQDLPTSVRQRLRRSVAKFNELFSIEAIAHSGLLPPRPISDPPVYDRAGRQKVTLPPKLDVKNAHRGIYPIWRAICAAGDICLPDEPTPDDLLVPETWAKITELSPTLINLKPTSWAQYLTRARSQLLSAATNVPKDPDALPVCFENMVQENEDRWHLNLLWRQIRASDIPSIKDASAAELLELDVWRALWRAPPNDVAYTTFKAFMQRARKILLQYAPGHTDPLHIVARAWVDLPSEMKAALAPIRKAAEASLLRPQDVSVQWLDALVLEGRVKASVCEALNVLPDVIRAAQEKALAASPEPELQVWQEFRKIARSRGFETHRLGPVITPAVKAGLAPTKLNRDWILEISADLPCRKRAMVGLALRELDAMLHDPKLSPLLYRTPLGQLPDARSPGMVDLPEKLVVELTALGDALDSADSTRRESRAVVRKIVTAAVQQGIDISNLYELLAQAEKLGFEGDTLLKAKRLRAHCENLCDPEGVIRA